MRKNPFEGIRNLHNMSSHDSENLMDDDVGASHPLDIGEQRRRLLESHQQQSTSQLYNDPTLKILSDDPEGFASKEVRKRRMMKMLHKVKRGQATDEVV